MNTSRVLIRLLAGVVVLAGFAGLLSADWPQWRGPDRSGRPADFKAPESWPQSLAEKWKLNVGLGNSGPVVVGDKLYIFTRQGDDEVILCLEAASGKELWRDKYPAPRVTGADRGHAGPRAAPAVADGKVVTLGVAGMIYCWQADGGKLAWRNDSYKVVPRFHTASSPMIVDQLVIAQVGSERDGAIIALDLADGKEKWKWTGDGQQYSSPMLMTVDGVRQIVAMTANKVVGVALADGKLLWQVDFVARGRSYNAITPIIDGATVIFAGDGRGTTAVKIEKKDDGFAAAPVWANADVGAKFATPVLLDGRLYGVSDAGRLFCLNAADGKLLWQGDARLGDYGAVIAAGSTVMVLPNNGELIVLRAGEKLEQLAKYKVAQSATYAYPAVVGNRIYVKDQENLLLLAAE